MDRELRALERLFDEAPDEERAESVRRARRRHGLPVPSRILRFTKRWKRLRKFVERWYAKPLSHEDGSSEEEIVAVEKRLGVPLPVALREWFALVGKRLEGIQDAPATLDALARDENDLIPVWHENQGIWTISVDASARLENPRVIFAFEGEPYDDPGPLVATLLALVRSETLVGASKGLFGELGESVRGGHVEGVFALDDYRVLAGPAYPSRDDDHDCRGDATTLLRGGPRSVEWMTATAASFDRLSPLLRLDETSSWRLVLRFEHAPGDPRGTRNADANEIGKLGVAVRGVYVRGSTQEVTIITKDPRGDFEKVQAAKPGAVSAAGYRSEKIAQFTPLWPPGAKSFRLSR